ncbi:MAG: PAS domain S-box protein [Sulfuricurvum sp.]
MKFKWTLFSIMGIIFLFFISTIWLLGSIQSKSANEAWGIKLMQTDLELKKQQTFLPIIQEIALIRHLAQEPAIIAMAHDEFDPLKRAKGLEVLEHYRLQFHDKSYFAAFTQGRNFYYEDNNHSNKGKNPLYTLNPKEPQDQWFYATIASGKPFEINVQTERIMNVTKIWINYVVHDHGRIVGVIGTGFNLNDLIHPPSSSVTGAVRSFFIKKDLSIQLANDHEMIDYNSVFKDSDEHKTIIKMIDKPSDIEQIKDAVETLEYEPNTIKMFWMSVQGEKNLVGITYSPEIGLYDITFFNNKALVLLDNRNLFVVLTLLFILAILIVGVWTSGHILSPIKQLKEDIATFHRNHERGKLTVMVDNEIGQLTHSIQALLDQASHQQTILALSKNHLEVILDQTEEAIAILDEHHKLVVINRAWEAMLGYAPSQLHGKKVKNILPANDWREHLSFLRTLDRPSHRPHHHYLTKKGEINVVYVDFIPMASHEILMIARTPRTQRESQGVTLHLTITPQGDAYEA